MVKVADYQSWGGEVFIQPDDNTDEIYVYHLDDNQVKAGQHVIVGDQIGLSGGQTSGGDHPAYGPGMSSGPHTHIGYFTTFVSTPIGVRPYGPDITGTLNQIRASGLPGGNSATSPTPTQAAAGTATPLPAPTGVFKVGLVIIALTLLIIGLYFLFKRRIDTSISSGKDDVKTGMKVASLL